MKNFIKFLLYFGISTALVLVTTSCKEDADDPVGSDFEELSQYMVGQNLDLPDLLNGWVIAGSGLEVNETDYSVPNYYVIDLRKAEDFEAGHIKGAVNTTMANLLSEADNAAGKPILAVCYTGQTAARAVGLLRLSGFPTAKSLKWGMAGWHNDFAGKWENGIGDTDSPNWLTSGDPEPVKEFSYPVFSTYETNPANMLKARVQQALQNGTWMVNNSDVLANPENYFLNNFWPEESWNAYGHIKGAYRFSTINMGILNNYDPSSTLVTYCYTGQTSAITTAWLEVLGYNAKSLKFGVNGINHAALVVGDAGSAHKKSWHGAGSASELNFGYYTSDGTLVPPLP